MGEEELSGQGQQETPPPTDESASLGEQEGTSSETESEVDVVKELQDRLSAQGRELADARTRAARAEGFASQVATRLQNTERRLESLGATLSERDKRQEEARLAALPPEEREMERLRLRTDQLERALANQAEERANQRTAADEERETAQKAMRMTAQACVDFGLEQDEMFAWNDSRLDWSSPEAYWASARKLARKISNGQETPTPAQQNTVWGGDPSTVANNSNVQRGEPKRGSQQPQLDQKKIIEEAAKAVLRELQAGTGGAPHNARPAAAAANPFADMIPDRKADPYQRVMDGYDPKKGPRATREKLKATLAEAEQAFGRAAR